MKPESHAWQQLQKQAAAQLRTGFATQVLRTAKGPEPTAWRRLRERGAAQLRAGFADRVLRAVRIELPSFSSQVAFSAATTAICLFAVLYLHERSTRLENERNLADWQQVEAEAQALGLNL